ncbi:hypothetical protein TNCV_3244431 [Trichonephila clavipes]|nr:hypothetical protein TNCV_3244431 [Trichonephila clavipes]
MSFLRLLCFIQRGNIVYEASAIFATLPEIKPGSFAQFVHDNADFNISTINGKATFHYMRSIEIITPADSIQPRLLIKRLKTLPPESVSLLKKGIFLIKCIQLLWVGVVTPTSLGGLQHLKEVRSSPYPGKVCPLLFYTVEHDL